MNIFFLHRDPRKCARYHIDRHVVKMIIELAQLLCSAIWSTGIEAPYKETHKNHPSAIWVRQSKHNWNWTYNLALELCKEYTYRYGKTHKTEDIIKGLICPELPDTPFTDPAQVVPDEYQNSESMIGYRAYYAYGKKHLHLWKKRHAWKDRKPPKFIRRIYPEYLTMFKK